MVKYPFSLVEEADIFLLKIHGRPSWNIQQLVWSFRKSQLCSPHAAVMLSTIFFFLIPGFPSSLLRSIFHTPHSISSNKNLHLSVTAVKHVSQDSSCPLGSSVLSPNPTHLSWPWFLKICCGLLVTCLWADGVKRHMAIVSHKHRKKCWHLSQMDYWYCL